MLGKPQLIPNEGKNSEGQRKRKGLSRKKLAFSSADQRELIVLQTLGLFIYLFLVLVQLLIPAKTPHAQLTCVVHYVPIWQQDWHLPWQQPADASNTLVCLCPHNSTERKQKEHPGVCHTDALANVWANNIISCLQQGLKEHVRKWTWVKPKLWTDWDTWQSRRRTGALGTEAEIWGLCRNEDNLLLGIPHPQHSLSLNKLWWKERLLWLSMERFPGMLDCCSGMYRLNGPIWKLTEMKRKPYGHITNGIST